MNAIKSLLVAFSAVLSLTALGALVTDSGPIGGSAAGSAAGSTVSIVADGTTPATGTDDWGWS
ncbi:hypothetical protein [Streptomyces sp. NPDC126499]|uniref:hypothetical protein n=1 Tax=Streptomyces sp. NPDC126499 TaxID=3155314 RepID=UPI00331D7078